MTTASLPTDVAPPASRRRSLAPSLAFALAAARVGLGLGGFGLGPTFEVFGAVVVLIALSTAVVAWRARPVELHD